MNNSTSLDPITPDLRNEARSKAANCAAWFVAIVIGMTLVPGTAERAKKETWQ